MPNSIACASEARRYSVVLKLFLWSPDVDNVWRKKRVVLLIEIVVSHNHWSWGTKEKHGLRQEISLGNEVVVRGLWSFTAYVFGYLREPFNVGKSDPRGR